MAIMTIMYSVVVECANSPKTIWLLSIWIIYPYTPSVLLSNHLTLGYCRMSAFAFLMGHFTVNVFVVALSVVWGYGCGLHLIMSALQLWSPDRIIDYFPQQSPRTGLALLQGVGPCSVCYSFFLKLYLMFNSDKTCSVFPKIFYGASVRCSALDFLCKLTICRNYLLHGRYVFCHFNPLKWPARWCAESRRPLTIVAAKVTETNDATEALNNVLKSLQDQVSLPYCLNSH
jgi:hypothetical protein